MRFSLFGKRRIYADWAATTPVHPRVLCAMKKARQTWGNPSAIYKEGVEAKRVLEGARTKSARILGVKPEEIMMAAAHSVDLKAAKDCGLRTGYIYRPNEMGAGSKTEKISPGEFDVVSTDMIDLAKQMGA